MFYFMCPGFGSPYLLHYPTCSVNLTFKWQFISIYHNINIYLLFNVIHFDDFAIPFMQYLLDATPETVSYVFSTEHESSLDSAGALQTAI